MTIDKKVLWEAVKEPLRLLVLSVIPLLLAYFTQLSWEGAGTIIVILRLIDSYMHEVGKKTDEDSLILGLTRF